MKYEENFDNFIYPVFASQINLPPHERALEIKNLLLSTASRFDKKTLATKRIIDIPFQSFPTIQKIMGGSDLTHAFRYLTDEMILKRLEILDILTIQDHNAYAEGFAMKDPYLLACFAQKGNKGVPLAEVVEEMHQDII